jgi:type III restriction enzyme
VPQIERTQTVVRTKMGWGVATGAVHTTTGQGETLTRERFYEEHRVQRSAFEIARDTTEVLAGGQVSMGEQAAGRWNDESARLLFPQVLRVVEAYLERRVKLAPEARIEEVALAIYRDRIVERLLAAIEPDESAGEAPLLPRIERFRPIGSTAQVQFRTTKTAIGTIRSHISHIVCDSTYEQTARFHLEQAGNVTAYAKNDHLDCEIPYEWDGAPHKYVPDFLVRMNVQGKDLTLILEMKGYEDEQARAKHAAARKWVKAVNHHGGFGLWDFLVCKSPNSLGGMLRDFRPSA